MKAIDFFCGAGGLSCGFKQAGIKVLGGIDIDISFKETYENNIKSKFFHSSISGIAKKTLIKEFEIYKNQKDLIFVGCSPCQYYSNIKTDKTKSGENRLLLEDFQKFVAHFNPGYVLIENVPGFDKNTESPLGKFKSFLSKKGYFYKDGVLNAKYFGVPQNRRRYVLLASKTNNQICLPKPDKKNIKTVINTIGDQTLFKPIKAGEIDITSFMHSSANLSDLNSKRIKKTLKNGGDRRVWQDDPELQLKCYKEHTGHYDVYGRMYWDKPSPAITTKFRYISNGRYGHPEQDRAISLREGATLQSFPLDYTFHSKSLTKIAKMIGNAVPPELARRMGKKFWRILMPQFRTKARAIELLGKGQIADLPTAITELWKNGYDAYAGNLEAQLFCKGYEGLDKPLFVLSDDGTGMSEDDLLNKWIVIGTDTKAKAIKDIKGEDTLGKDPRIKTGEKGIGRLSVSYLGTQMLLLTKKRNCPLFSLFFDWRILDNFNLYLEEIQIPLLKVEDSNNFPLTFDKLKKDFMRNLDSQNTIQWEGYEDLYKVLIGDTKKLKLPSFFDEVIIENFGPNKNDKHGTKFIIFDPIDQISELMDADRPDEAIPDGVFYNISSLSGLANQFIEEKKDFKTKFNVYKSEIPIDIIQQREFFTHKDFDNCDHLIAGEFDENGFFNGTVKIYGKTINHEFRPHKPPGKSSYGPFHMKIGYIPGKQDSILADEQFDKYNKMLKRYGGFYIYRDGFRVLPYGRPDQDFLGFEERRSLGAGYYFFSYRRMFGYTAISRSLNPNLRDKAGREGFVSNKAYRDFQSDLKEFFIDLSKKYFRTAADFSYKDDQLKEIKEEKLEKEREKAERKEFNKNIKEYPGLLKDYRSQVYTLVDELEILVGKSEVVYDKIEKLLIEIDKLRSGLRVIIPPAPKRFKPTDNQREKLFAYSSNYHEIFDMIEQRYQKVYSAAKKKLKEKELLEEFNRKIENYAQEFKKIKSDFDKRIKKIANGFVYEIDTLNVDFLFQFDSQAQKLIPIKLSRPDLESNLELLDKMYLDIRNDFEGKITPFIEHLERLNINIDEDKLVGYYKMQYEEIKDQWQQTQELAQLGIAVEIIDHQFNALYSQLANIIGMFKDSIKDNHKSKKLYKILVSTFEHLQNNYKFLTPLYRTTGRTRKNISGKEIKEYIEAFYSERFQNDNIKLTSTKAFDNSIVYAYESIIKPVFINVVNNAVYWLASAKKRKIHLDYKDDSYLIVNSGQPIDDIYIEEDIFKLFFSRKPKGRGIGLFLAKTTLNSIGFKIEATNDPKYNIFNGACFIISKVK